MPEEKKPRLLQSIPAAIAIPAMSLVAVVLVALSHSARDPNLLQELALPLLLGGMLVVGSAYWLVYLSRVEKALRQAEEKYRSIFENSVEGIFQSTVDGSFTTANPALARMLGFSSPDELLAAQIDLNGAFYVDPGRRLELKKRLQEDGWVSDFESEVYRRDGSRIWILENTVAVRNARGDVLYYEGSMVDISAHRQIEQTLRDSHEKQAAWISELEQRTRDLTLLNRMSDRLQACANVEEAYGVIAQQARQLFPRESGRLYIIDSAQNLVRSVAAWRAASRHSEVFNTTGCVALRDKCTQAVETSEMGGPLNVCGPRECPYIPRPVPASYLCVPLVAQDEMLGVLHLSHSPEAEGFDGATGPWYTDARQQLAHTVADSLALSLLSLKLRETLHQQSIRDPLTTMFNRRYMEESLEREIRRSKRASRPLGLIMVDIDDFKQFNDGFGHDAGDAVLREIGVFLRSRIRGEDIVCRYGGEEFVLILPDAPLDVTCIRAEQVRQEVKGLRVRYKEQLLGSVSFSVGVSVSPIHGATGDALLHAADLALYQAKKAGRDRVMIAAFPGQEEARP